MIGQRKVGFGVQLARRSVLRLGAGGVLAAGLAACGGGGSGDSTAEKQQALRDAFAKLRDGMVWTDVEALVGFPANNIRNDTEVRWVIDEVVLDVRFFTTGSKEILVASLKEKGSITSEVRRF
jgi:hypothetical protein